MFKTAPLKQVVAFIAAQTGYRTSTEKQLDATKRTQGVVVQRVGTWDTGEPLDEIDRPVFDIWCYARNIGTAYDMADEVSRAMARFDREPHVTSCEQISAYDDSGPDYGPQLKLGYRITYID